MKRTLIALSILTLACSSSGGPRPAPQSHGPTDRLDSGGCGKVFWHPNECDPHEPGVNRDGSPHPENDKVQLVKSIQRTCARGGDLSLLRVVGQRNPTVSGVGTVNGTISGTTVTYRCGFARVFSHEVECHYQRNGCACEDPHEEWGCD